ncbi:Cytoplasmic dynein 2 light intermediate chain 1 [Diplonema papillatum]|nr:Cytoplasmic dynein 2 light intermediate chain 1 [Diplonema papillatum]
MERRPSEKKAERRASGDAAGEGDDELDMSGTKKEAEKGPPKLKLDRNKTLWDNIAATKPSGAVETQDVNVLVIGSRKGGKSTLIQRFIKKDEATIPKPTSALEYSHGRKEEGKKVQTAHFWEVGGGCDLHMLMDVVISPENIHTLVAVVVVDLSDPRTLWHTLTASLSRMNKRVQECYARMKVKNNTTPDRLLQRHKRKIGEDHADLSKIMLNGIPTVIVGTKYDMFHDNPHTKIMAKTLRFIAHRNGMHLAWVSTKDEKDMTRFRLLMSNLVFGTPFAERYINLDYAAGPLMVWPGRDSFEQIGPPIGLQKPPENFASCGDAELDAYKRPYDDVYPPKPSQQQEKDLFSAALYEEFEEREIDAYRRQKDEELRKSEQAKAGKAARTA